MQICSYASLGAALTLGVALAFSACASQPTPEPASAAEPADAFDESAADMPEEPVDEAAQASGDSESMAVEEGAEAGPADEGGDTGRSLAEIQQIVKAHRQPVRDCYEKAEKELPGLKGDLTINFVIKPDGSVKEASVNQERTTLKSPAVSTCAIDVIKGLKFPADERGMETTVNYPYNFNP